MQNLLVVGNGFDLACGIKTDVDNFLELNINKLNNNDLISFIYNAKHYKMNYLPEWNNFEKLICQYLNFINYLFSNDDNLVYEYKIFEGEYGTDSFCSEFIITIRDANLLPLSILNAMKLICSNKILSFYESDLGTRIFDTWKDLDKHNTFKVIVSVQLLKRNLSVKNGLAYVIKQVEKELQELESNFQSYIKQVGKTYDETKVNTLSKMLNSLNITRVVSFNYTHTLNDLFYIENALIKYIHGDIDKSIVIGIEENMIENQSITINSEFKNFFKRYRRLSKDTLSDYSSLILDNLNELSSVYFYGHSLDKSDSSIIRELFEKRFSKYFIYCYDDVKIYKDRIFDIIGIDLFENLVKNDSIVYISLQK